MKDKDAVFYCASFELYQNDACFKVGTDAVILGGFLPDLTQKRVLDMGCGTGILSFIAMQRNASAAVGIDINPEAIALASRSTRLNPKWAHHMQFKEADLRSFQTNNMFDTVVSNPPYFFDDTLPKNATNAQAKHQSRAFLSDLLACASRNLTPQGMCYMIIPSRYGQDLLNEAEKTGFYLDKQCLVSGKVGKPPHRWLVALTRSPQSNATLTKLALRDENGTYTEAYQHFTAGLLR